MKNHNEILSSSSSFKILSLLLIHLLQIIERQNLLLKMYDILKSFSIPIVLNAVDFYYQHFFYIHNQSKSVSAI